MLMMKTQCLSFVAGLLVATAVLTSGASAGVITGVTMFGPNAGTGPGLGTVAVPVVNTFSPNNDNTNPNLPNDNNIVVPIKRFDNIGPIDIEFLVQPSAGTTEYFVFESVDNNTGVPWNTYHMILGHGTGAGFMPSLSGDGLDFDDPNYHPPPIASAMPVVNISEDHLVFNGGIHGAGAESYRFRIDVPNFPLGPGFTIRQFPVAVPEPATFALLGV